MNWNYAQASRVGSECRHSYIIFMNNSIRCNLEIRDNIWDDIRNYIKLMFVMKKHIFSFWISSRRGDEIVSLSIDWNLINHSIKPSHLAHVIYTRCGEIEKLFLIWWKVREPLSQNSLLCNVFVLIFNPLTLLSSVRRNFSW